MKPTRYRMKFRPASSSTLPPDLKWSFVEASWEVAPRRPDLPRSSWPYGVIAFERDLTPQEMKSYEMEEVPE